MRSHSVIEKKIIARSSCLLLMTPMILLHIKILAEMHKFHL